MNGMRLTPEEAQANAQFEYEAISAKVDSVKRKLDGGSNAVSYEQLSSLLDEQKMLKHWLDDANNWVRQQEAARPNQAEIKVRENAEIKRQREELKRMQKDYIETAEKAIQQAAPGSARVVDAYVVLGKPSQIKARLEDGSQWTIDGSTARQLTPEEIAAPEQMVLGHSS